MTDDTAELIYPEGQDVTSATIRAVIMLDHTPEDVQPWNDNDGWCSVIVPIGGYASGYNPTHADGSDHLVDAVQRYAVGLSFWPAGEADRAKVARFARIITGGPALLEWLEGYWAVCLLDPARCEASGAELTEETLRAELEDFKAVQSSEVYGVGVEYLTPESYRVGTSTQHALVGGEFVESQSVTTTDRDTADDYAREWDAEVEVIAPEWLPGFEGVTWGYVGHDWATKEAADLVAHTKREDVQP